MAIAMTLPGTLPGVLPLPTFAAAPPTQADSTLRIAISEGGRDVFDGMIPDIVTIGGLHAPPVVKYASALGVLREFCQGVGGNNPDMVLTTRRMRLVLATDCTQHGVEHMVQVELGRGALVLAVRKDSVLKGLTARAVYLALARDVPDKDEFRRNTAVRWSDIDPSLPPQDIRFQLPPHSDGDRALFDALILQGGCRKEPLVKLIFTADQRTARCVTTRVDRVREIPGDQAVPALLEAPPGTIGVLSYLELQQSNGAFVGLALDGVSPTQNAILNGSYDYADPYWLYAKRGQAQRGGVPAIDVATDRIVQAALTEPMLGPGGLVSKLGLVPLAAEDRIAQRAVFSPQPLSYGAAFDSVIYWVSYMADATRSVVGLALGQPIPEDTKGGQDFTTLMDLAGYQTQEFQTSVGLFPGAGMTFGIVREMSEADQDHLERTLTQDAHNRPGALAAFQRKIVRSILDVSESGEYEISQVQIEFLPLPSFKLIVSPKDAPMSQDTTSILRAVERLSDRVSEMSQ